MFRLRPLLVLLFVAVTLASVAPSADAAPRMSAGSRGMRTFSEPPPTATAPNVARPIERTMTQPPCARLRQWSQTADSLTDPACSVDSPPASWARAFLACCLVTALWEDSAAWPRSSDSYYRLASW